MIAVGAIMRTLIRIGVLEELKKHVPDKALHIYKESCYQIKDLIDNDLCQVSPKIEYEIRAIQSIKYIFNILPTVKAFPFFTFGYTNNIAYASFPKRSWTSWCKINDIHFYNINFTNGSLLFDEALYDSSIGGWKVHIPEPEDPFEWYDVTSGDWSLWAHISDKNEIFITCKPHHKD